MQSDSVRFLTDLIIFTNIHLNALPIYADISLKVLRKKNISTLIILRKDKIYCALP